jgi:hypothetical protein
MVPESERQPQIAAVPASRWRLLVPSVAQSRHAAIFRLPGPRQAVQRVGKFEPFQACSCARYPSVSHFTVMLRASCHKRCLTPYRDFPLCQAVFVFIVEASVANG